MSVIDRPGLAWITGASSGLGRALALELAARGWKVAVSARNASALRDLAAEADGTILPFPLDITDPGAVRGTVRAIMAVHGPIQLSILNAGTHRPTPAEDFQQEDAAMLVETNLLGTTNCLAALLPHAIERGRCEIAIVASQTGYRGLPTAAVYGATKAALINMAEALRPELKQHGVSLRLINPGFVDTPLTRRNTFPMPFLISAEDSARQILHGLATHRFEITTPRRMAFFMKLLRLMPNWLFFVVAKRMTPAPGSPANQRPAEVEAEPID